MGMYAAYIVMVEDTEEDDMALASHVASLERITGDLDYKQAEELLMRVSNESSALVLTGGASPVSRTGSDALDAELP